MTDKAKKRFWERVNKEESGCWLWTGFITRPGYGQVSINNANYLAHRAVYYVLWDWMPDVKIKHLCNNRHCVNPDHLQILPRRRSNPTLCAELTDREIEIIKDKAVHYFCRWYSRDFLMRLGDDFLYDLQATAVLTHLKDEVLSTNISDLLASYGYARRRHGKQSRLVNFTVPATINYNINQNYVF